MALHRLIYVSRPFGFDEATLNSILAEARERNAQSDVTGALICRADIYLQLLEGSNAAIEATFNRIVRDTRHLEVQRLIHEPAGERLFPAWTMRDDPARSWMWTQKDVAAGAIAASTHDEILTVFSRLAAEPEHLSAA